MNRDPQPPSELPGGPEPDPGLEGFLARARFRQPPRDWREMILAKALAPTCDDPDRVGLPLGEEPKEASHFNGSRRARPLPASNPGPRMRASWWDAWRSGWTVLAAAWGLVLGLNQYATPRLDPPLVRRPPWSDRALAEIRAQQALLAEWSEGRGREAGSGSTHEPESERVRPRGVVRPRAERRIQERGGMV